MYLKNVTPCKRSSNTRCWSFLVPSIVQGPSCRACTWVWSRPDGRCSLGRLLQRGLYPSVWRHLRCQCSPKQSLSLKTMKKDQPVLSSCLGWLGYIRRCRQIIVVSLHIPGAHTAILRHWEPSASVIQQLCVWTQHKSRHALICTPTSLKFMA